MDALLKADVDYPHPLVVLTIGDWVLWDWNDDAKVNWHLPYGMFHKCGIEQHHTVSLYNGEWKCRRCAENPPDGLVVSYEFLNWEAKGYGG